MKTMNDIDPCLADAAFEIDENSPSGLKWKKGHGNTNSGKPAGCLVDRGYKTYWQVIWKKKHYYCHRIVWAIKNKRNPFNVKVKS